MEITLGQQYNVREKDTTLGQQYDAGEKDTRKAKTVLLCLVALHGD